MTCWPLFCAFYNFPILLVSALRGREWTPAEAGERRLPSSSSPVMRNTLEGLKLQGWGQEAGVVGGGGHRQES